MLEISDLTLSERARLTRLARHWTQEQVAVLSRVKQEDVSRFERGLAVSDRIRNSVSQALGLEESGNDNCNGRK